MNFNSFKSKLTDASQSAKNKFSDLHQKVDYSSVLSVLSVDQLLNWTENISKSASTIYDKAMDAEYLKTHLGGGNHRMFDGGHDLDGAWVAIRNASPDDSFAQEVIAYFQAIWKDITTAKGLPFDTWSQDGYESFANWITSVIPGIDKEWVYDLLSFDALELFGSTLGGVAAFFALNDEDTKRLSEILGSMGIVSVISANPIMGMVMVIVGGYAYFKKKKEFNKDSLLKGAFTSGVAMTLFAVLGFPILIEIILVIVISMLIRKHWHRKIDLIPIMRTFYEDRILPTLKQGMLRFKGV